MTRHDDDRLLDLLAARATEGLQGPEASELSSLLAGDDEPIVDDLELAAAAADLAWMHEHGAFEAIPADVLRRMSDQAKTFGSSMSSSAPADAARTTDAPLPFQMERARPGGLPVWSGWMAAAAALVLLLISMMSGKEGATTAPIPAPTLSMATQLQDLLGRQGTIQVAWAPPEVEAYRDVRGDVIWNNATQSGFMRLVGLPTNRPDIEQYQLWIVDPSRDQNPIDGGVFDIPAGSDEAIIPINAKLGVNAPAAFAITLEQPGGVVVSDGPLLVVAAVES